MCVVCCGVSVRQVDGKLPSGHLKEELVKSQKGLKLRFLESQTLKHIRFKGKYMSSDLKDLNSAEVMVV